MNLRPIQSDVMPVQFDVTNCPTESLVRCNAGPRSQTHSLPRIPASGQRRREGASRQVSICQCPENRRSTAILTRRGSRFRDEKAIVPPIHARSAQSARASFLLTPARQHARRRRRSRPCAETADAECRACRSARIRSADRRQRRCPRWPASSEMVRPLSLKDWRASHILSLGLGDTTSGKVRRHVEREPTISSHKRLRLRGLRFSHNANTVFIRLEGDNAIISHTETLLAAREVEVLCRQAQQSCVNAACFIPLNHRRHQRRHRHRRWADCIWDCLAFAPPLPLPG